MINIDNINLSFVRDRYNREVKQVFSNFSLHVKQNEFVSILGNNGSGKSTLLRLINGDIKPNRGRIYIESQRLSALSSQQRAQKIAKVYQNTLIGTFSHLTIEENLALAQNRGKRLKFKRALSSKRRKEFIAKLSELDIGLEDHICDPVYSLSGGQRQALSLIMATLSDTKILLLDEHTSALDPESQKQIMKLTQYFVDKFNLTTLMVTHSLKNAIEYGNRLILLKDGNLVLDLQGEEKSALTTLQLMQYFTN